MPLKLPRIIGHRGASSYAPENTLEGIHTAADMDIEWVELDVKLTKDQIPIIFHDDTLDRTTNGHGPIAEATYEDIRQLEAGSWFGDSFAGAKIPTLEEALEVLIDRDLGFNMEIKPCPGREKETAEVALDILSQIWDDHESLYLSSYSTVSLETCMDMTPDWARGIVLGYHCKPDWLEALKKKKLPSDWQEIAEYLSLSAASIDQDFATAETIAALKQVLEPVPYNVNDSYRARELSTYGANTFISDAPDVTQDGLLSVH